MSIFDFFRKRKETPRGVVKVYSGHTVAKYLSGIDVDGYMYESQINRPDCCPICNNRIKDVLDLDVSLKMGKGDFGYTWDHYCIVSEKFKDFCIEGKYPNLEIIPLPKCKNLYFFQPHDTFKVDHERYGTKFTIKRNCCGEYDDVIRPSIIKAVDLSLPSNDFIMRTELRYASNYEKTFRVIVGTETAKKMKAYGLKGIYFQNILDSKGLKVTEKVVNAIVVE